MIVGCDSVTMQAQKEAPPDMQCKDKFLLQSVKTNDGATPKDITPEAVVTLHNVVSLMCVGSLCRMLFICGLGLHVVQ